MKDRKKKTSCSCVLKKLALKTTKGWWKQSSAGGESPEGVAESKWYCGRVIAGWVTNKQRGCCLSYSIYLKVIVTYAYFYTTQYIWVLMCAWLFLFFLYYFSLINRSYYHIIRTWRPEAVISNQRWDLVLGKIIRQIQNFKE